MIIVKKEKCLEIDGALIPFNSFQIAQMRNGVRLLNITTSQSIDVPLSASIDGQTFSTVIELVEWFAENGFKNGGGSGEGATWSGITGKPSGTERQVVRFNSSGQMEASTLGWKQLSDLPTPPTFKNGIYTGTEFQSDGSALFAFLKLAIDDDTPTSIAEPNTIPIYNAGTVGNGGGTLPVQDGIEDLDAVNVSQLKPVINSLFPTPSLFFGLEPTIGNGTVSTNRTRIDNSFQIISVSGEAVKLISVSVYVNATGSGKIKILSRQGDSYNVIRDIPVSYASIGVNTFTNFDDIIVANGSYIGFYTDSTASIAVSLGSTNSSVFRTGDYSSGLSVTSTTGLMQFNVIVEDKYEEIDSLKEKTRYSGYEDFYYIFNANGNGVGAGVFTVYNRLQNDKYVRYNIIREINLTDNVYVDYWRLAGAVVCIFNGTSFEEYLVAITPQESEFVYRTVGSIDFTGGFHGDEKVISALFFANDVLIDTGTSTQLKGCNSFYYIIKSTTHEAPTSSGHNPLHPVEAIHTKITKIREGGYSVKNIVEWQKSVVLSQFYSGICSVSRDVSSFAYSDKDYTLRNLDTESNLLLGGSGVRLYNAINNETVSAILCTSKVIEGYGKLIDSEQVMDIRDNGLPLQYKKYYRGIPSDVSTSEGDIFISEMEVDIYSS